MHHKIFLCNNMEIDALASDSIHLTVTSPPYVTTAYEKGQEFKYDEFVQNFKFFSEKLFRVTTKGGRFALNVADMLTKYRYSDSDTLYRIPFGPDMLQAAESVGFRLLERFIWDKGFTRNFGGPLLGSYPYPMTIYNNNYFEYIYILQKPGKRKVKQAIRAKSRLTLDEWRSWTQQWWRIESQTEKFDYHRAIYPVEIPYRLIRMYSYAGDTILDPYIGTGATLFAADKCERDCIGFEIDKNCKEFIRRRFEFEMSRGELSKFPEIFFYDSPNLMQEKANGS